MSKLTADQILKKIEELFKGNVSSFAYGDYTKIEDAPYDKDLSWKENEKKIQKFMGLGEIEEIEKVGGEDQGSTWYSIKYFKDHDVYIKTNGYYQSYSGTDFYDGFGKEVKPAKKTVTVFE